MSTPIGHSLLGIAFCRLVGRPSAAPNWRWYGFGIVAANAPDLDFLPGILLGDMNLYHQGPSHSILAAVIFACAAGVLLAKWLSCKATHVAAAGFLLYSSHLLLDLLGTDRREPFGIPLLWPFSDQHWISSLNIFDGIRHGVPGDSLMVVIGELLSGANLLAVGTEILVLAPLLVLSVLVTRVRWSTGSSKRID